MAERLLDRAAGAAQAHGGATHLTHLPDITCAIEIDAPITRVWTCLTDEALVAHWLGCIGFRPEVGALFYMQADPGKRASGDVSGATHCAVEALEPPERIRFSWFMPGTPKTYVEIVLSVGADGTTTARLLHGGWDQFAADDLRAIHQMLDGGWRSYVLPGLKRVAEG